MTRDSHFKRTKHHPSSDSLHSRPLVSATTPPSRVCNNMSDNPLQHLFQKVSNCIQTHLANFTGQPQNPSSSTSKNTIFSLSPPSSHLSSKIYPANRDTSSVQAKDVLNKVTPFIVSPYIIINLHQIWIWVSDMYVWLVSMERRLNPANCLAKVLKGLLCFWGLVFQHRFPLHKLDY